MATKFDDARRREDDGSRCARQSESLWTWALVAAFLVVTTASSARAQTVFDNFNNFAVVNGPTAPTTFTVSVPTNVAQIIGYFWDDGHGAQPGTFKLLGASGSSYGPYGSKGVVGSNNVRNAAWVATIVGLRLPPDTYTIIVSDPQHWSQNAQSGGKGFARIYGSAAPVSGSGGSGIGSAGVGSQCPAPFPNCTCHGTGCTHPDLRPWGGDGPTGVGPHIAIPFNPSAFFWEQQLPPTTAPATLAQRCSLLHGTLVTLLDDPWRYFFSGFFATMGCRR